MSGEKIVGEWYFNDLLGYKGTLPSESFGRFYGKCLMDIIAADGVIHDEERQWVIGFALISAYPENVIQELENYDPVNNKEGIKTLQTDIDQDYVKQTRLSLVSNAFRPTGADEEIHAQEAEAISQLAIKLGVTDEQIQQVRQLYEEDLRIRNKRAATLVPKKLDTVLSELEKAN